MRVVPAAHMFKSLHLLSSVTFYSLGFLFMTSSQSIAQVTSDGTVNTQITQDGNTSEITEGETRGCNLFHSFQNSSVITGNEAFFDNADSISNIFARVSGYRRMIDVCS